MLPIASKFAASQCLFFSFLQRIFLISYLGVECVAQIFVYFFRQEDLGRMLNLVSTLANSFISSDASLSMSVSVFSLSIGGSRAKSWSSSSEELSISLLSSVFIRK